MTTWDDIDSYCKDLSEWVIESNKVDEINKAFPKSTFPITADREIDTIPEGLETLFYLTLWVAASSQTKAPDHIESRILFMSSGLESPWKKLYITHCKSLDENQEIPFSNEDWTCNLVDRYLLNRHRAE